LQYLLYIARRQAENQGIKDNQSSAPGLPPNPTQTVAKNPVADFFQVSDPSTRQGLDAVYGAYNGDIECTKQFFCIVGNSLHNMPGREVIFT